MLVPIFLLLLKSKIWKQDFHLCFYTVVLLCCIMHYQTITQAATTVCICPMICPRGERALLRPPAVLAERNRRCCHDARRPEEAIDAAAVTTAPPLALPVGLRERTRKRAALLPTVSYNQGEATTEENKAGSWSKEHLSCLLLCWQTGGK